MFKGRDTVYISAVTSLNCIVPYIRAYLKLQCGMSLHMKDTNIVNMLMIHMPCLGHTISLLHLLPTSRASFIKTAGKQGWNVRTHFSPPMSGFLKNYMQVNRAHSYSSFHPCLDITQSLSDTDISNTSSDNEIKSRMSFI